jgi:TetR/AcrR family transcriptional repressor of nem operon
MGRVSQAQATQNRERIVGTAARLFRERGMTGVSVADVMAEAGLTHGGFYKHFTSKDALVAEAVTLAFTQQAAHLNATVTAPPSPSPSPPPQADLIAPEPAAAAGPPASTGPDHAAAQEPTPPQNPATTRERSAEHEHATPQERATKDGRTAVVDAYLSAAHRDAPGSGCPTAGFGGDVARAIGGDATRQAYAKGVEEFARLLSSDDTPDLATLSTMVGALILSRATAGTELSDQILAAARSALISPPHR